MTSALPPSDLPMRSSSHTAVLRLRSDDVEVLAIGDKKGICKLALQQGIPIHIVVRVRVGVRV